jgi:hypothetical protein
MEEIAINSYFLNLKKWNAATYSKYFLAWEIDIVLWCNDESA